MANSINNFVMAINISIDDSVKNYSCHNVFNEKNVNTFDVLTSIQMRAYENKFWQVKRSLQVGISAYTKK